MKTLKELLQEHERIKDLEKLAAKINQQEGLIHHSAILEDEIELLRKKLCA